MNEATIRKPSIIPMNRRRKRPWIVGGFMATLVVAGFFVEARLTNPVRVRRTAEVYLQRYFTVPVCIGSADFTWFDGIRLNNVTIGPRSPMTDNNGRSDSFSSKNSASSEGAEPVFSCEQIVLRTRGWSFLEGRLDIESLHARSPKLTIVRSTDTGLTNITGIIRTFEKNLEPVAIPWPTFELAGVRLVVMAESEGDHRLVEDLTLTIRGRRETPDSHTYDVVWEEDKANPAHGRSRIDLSTGMVRNVSGGLPWMSLEAVLIALNPEYTSAGTWVDFFGLGGDVRVSDFRLGGFHHAGGIYQVNKPPKPNEPNESIEPAELSEPAESIEPVGRFASIQLRECPLSVPLNQQEEGLPSDQRYLRFENVEGSVVFTPAKIQADFKGNFHGALCSVKAGLRGEIEGIVSLDDVALNATLLASGLPLPANDPLHAAPEYRFINRWKPLSDFYGDFDPHGKVDLRLQVSKRAGSGESAQVTQLEADVFDGDVSYRLFPYRVSELSGSLRFEKGAMSLGPLCGMHGGGSICLNGTIPRFAWWSPIDLDITAKSVPIDKALVAALPKKYRAVSDLFNPQGNLDVDVALERLPSLDGRRWTWRKGVTLHLDDVAACYVRFPQLIENLSGTIVFDERQLDILDLQGTVADGPLSVDGTVLFNQDDLEDLSLELRATDVSLGSELLGALPPPIQEQVCALQPEGRVDVDATLALDESSPLPYVILRHQRTTDFSPRGATSASWLHDRVRSFSHVQSDVSISLNGVSIKPQAFPVSFDDIRGCLRTQGDYLLVDELRGRLSSGEFESSGVIALSGEESAGSRVSYLDWLAHDVRLNESLREHLPEEVRRSLAPWRIEGPWDFATTFEWGGAQSRDHLFDRATVRLSGAKVQHVLLPLTLEDVRTDINITLDSSPVTVEGSTLTADHIQARAAGGSVIASLNATHFKDKDDIHLRVLAKEAELGKIFSGVLPSVRSGIWSRLNPQGRVDMHLDQIHFQRIGKQPFTCSAVGQITLHDATLQDNGNLRHLNGKVDLSGWFIDRLGGTSLEGQCKAVSLEIHGRRLQNVNARWSLARTATGHGRLGIEGIRGTIHEGDLNSSFALMFDPKGSRYDVSATVQDASAAALLMSDQRRPGLREPVQIDGRVNAGLFVSGRLGEPASRRGGGRFELLDSQIYRTPLAIAIMNLLNLSVPGSHAFRDARTTFYILGNRVDLTEVELSGEALTLTGSGTMQLPSGSVDLHLINNTSGMWRCMPVLGDVFSGVSDKLFRIEITGSLYQPAVRARALGDLSEEMADLFKKRPPTNLRPSSGF